MVQATSWTSLAVTGRPIIGTICEEIRKSDLLIADITNLNPNVLFELGFAVTQPKRLWLIFNPKVAGAKVLFDRQPIPIAKRPGDSATKAAIVRANQQDR